MGLYPVFSLQVYRSCFKVRLHYSETFFDLPSSLIDSDDLRYISLYICRYCIEPIIHRLFIYGCLIELTIFFFCHLTIRSDRSLFYKSGRIIRITSILLKLFSIIIDHLHSTFDLSLSNLCLISLIFRRIRYDHRF